MPQSVELGRRRLRSQELTVPATIGPYRLCLELGSGGMASVYLAALDDGRRERDRYVALKVIHPHLAKQRGFMEMFADEADVASRIRHPNVCRVFDFDVDGWPYIAMEYLLGESLAKVHRTLSRRADSDPGSRAAKTALALAQACAGLHAAHELSDDEGEPLEVVHRDVSPENIFLTYDGVAKIVDFGVAAMVGKRHRTQTGVVKGKFAYLAPELLNPQAKVDRRADIWSLGVVAWELLTAQRLFRRDSAVDTLRAILDMPLKPPSEVCPGLPDSLDAVVMGALSRDPAERHPTARELARELAQCAIGAGQINVHSDLADWMSELFPGGRARRQGHLDLAARSVIGEAPQFGDEAPLSRRRAEPRTKTSTTHATPAGPTVADPVLARDGSSAVRKPPSRSRLAVLVAGAGAIAIAVAGAFGGWVAHLSADPREPSPVSLSPAGVAGAPSETGRPREARHPEAPRIGLSPRSEATIPPVGEPDLRVVRGDYVLRVSEGSDGALVLRVERTATAGTDDETPVSQTAGVDRAARAGGGEGASQ
jgi:serine/threonine-protein kinase